MPASAESMYDLLRPHPGPPRVLLATDFSEASAEAAWLAVRLPYREAPEVAVLNVVSAPTQPSSVALFAVWPEIMAKLHADAAARLEDVAEPFRPMAKFVRTVVRRGAVADQILTEAASSHSELIVIGAQGHSAVERVLLGSVSDTVATHAGCSTLVVRPTGLRDEPGTAADATEQRPLRALVAVDETDQARRAVRELQSYHWGPGAEITLLHVMEMYGLSSDGASEVDPDILQELKDASLAELERLAGPLRETGAGVTVDVRTARRAGKEIVRRAQACRADIVAVGDRGRPSTFGVHLGSVSRHVLRHFEGSVWICRGRRA
ncbi:universal stress protein [Alienimonas sp. DA493]|uniref:universal stress protein n=1 Tax=Alienimonas sp. DA493 TaxID=3373605 RepID=UPI003754E8DB